MKLEEAVNSGKPFKRKDWNQWIIVSPEGDFPDAGIVFENDREVDFPFVKSDITADDYELREE